MGENAFPVECVTQNQPPKQLVENMKKPRSGAHLTCVYSQPLRPEALKHPAESWRGETSGRQMKRLEEHLFRCSEMRLDGNLQEEKRRVFEQFQFSSARARKFAQENNRRRKALEERQKQWDIEEEQMRQDIIQQRKQRINNATQRFQRRHLPPPRYKHFQRINVPTVEEALIEIQSKLDSCNFQSSITTSNYGKDRNHSSSPNAIKPQSSHHQALTAVEAISQLLPVKKKTDIISSQETQHQQHKQQHYTPRDSHPSENCDSESLSSKDSLENADTKYRAETSHLSPPFDSQKPRAGPTSFTEIIVLGDDSSNSGKHYSYHQKKQEAVEQFNRNKLHTFFDNRSDNAFQKEGLEQIGWRTHHQKSPTESTVNIFSTTLNSKCKAEKLKMTSVKHTFLNNSKSNAPKYPQQQEADMKKLPISGAIAHPGKKVRFNKGVLNNQSEYGSLDSPSENHLEHFTFPKNLASMIRDSIELTKVKNKELWGNNKVKQKRCCFDEGQTKENDINNHTKDRRLNHSRASGVSKPDPSNLIPIASTGYDFAKQAWTDAGVQVRLQEDRAQDISGPLNSLSGGSKAPQRKGTVCVQPPPATEVNLMSTTQGKNGIFPPTRRGMICEEMGMALDCTPTDEQISQMWHSVRSALTTQHGKTPIRTNDLEVKRKPHLEQIRLYPDPGSRRVQRPLQTTEPVRLLPSTCDGIFPVKRLSVPKAHKSKLYADILEDGGFVAAMEQGQKHRPGMMQKPCKVLHGLSTISMEEHNVLLSLERLDQLLQCIRKKSDGHVLKDKPSAQDIKSTKHHVQHLT